AALAIMLAATGSSPRLTATVQVGRAPCGATVAFGGVWVAVDGPGTIVRIDPTRARVNRSIRVGATACSVSAGRDALWVARYRPSELVRVDRRSGAIRRFHLGRVPFDVLAASSIWTTWFEDGTLTRLDPQTSRVVERIRVGGNPAGLALCRGQLWV